MSRQAPWSLALAAACAALGLAGCEGAQRRKEAEKFFAQAEEWYRDRKYNEAGKLYAEALALRPEYPEAALGLGNVLRDQCKMETQHVVGSGASQAIDARNVRRLYEESESWLMHAMALRADYRDAHYSLGLLYYDTAIAKSLPQEKPYQLAQLQAGQERFERAYVLAPANGAPQEYLAHIYFLLGFDHASRGELMEAIGLFEKSQASCDRFLAWLWKQPIKNTFPELFDQTVKDMEGLKSDVSAGLEELRAKAGVAGAATERK